MIQRAGMSTEAFKCLMLFKLTIVVANFPTESPQLYTSRQVDTPPQHQLQRLRSKEATHCKNQPSVPNQKLEHQHQ